MYLIIERDHRGDLFAYFETKTQFKKVQSQRGGLRLMSGKRLDHECALEDLPTASYMVIPVIAKTIAIEKLLPPKKKVRRKKSDKKTQISRS